MHLYSHLPIQQTQNLTTRRIPIGTQFISAEPKYLHRINAARVRHKVPNYSNQPIGIYRIQFYGQHRTLNIGQSNLVICRIGT